MGTKNTDTDARDADQQIDVTEYDVPDEVAKYVAALEGQVADLEARVAKAGEADDPEADPEKEPEGEPAAAASAETDADPEAVLKGLPEPIRKMVEDARSAAAEAQQIAKFERDRRETAEAIEKAAAPSYAKLPGWKAAEMGPVLKRLQDKAPDEFKALDAILRGANEAIGKGSLYAEIGKSGGRAPSDGESRIDVAAAAIAKDKGVSIEKARMLAMEADPELYDAAIRANGAG